MANHSDQSHSLISVDFLRKIARERNSSSPGLQLKHGFSCPWHMVHLKLRIQNGTQNYPSIVLWLTLYSLAALRLGSLIYSLVTCSDLLQQCLPCTFAFSADFESLSPFSHLLAILYLFTIMWIQRMLWVLLILWIEIGMDENTCSYQSLYF
jgi:hypothetical protein